MNPLGFMALILVIGVLSWIPIRAVGAANAPATREQHFEIRIGDAGVTMAAPPTVGGSRTAPLPRQFAMESRGPRTGWKCAQVLYARGERAHERGAWRFRMPPSCVNANAEAPYRAVPQLSGIALYRGATLLSFLEGSGQQTAAAPPPPAAPKRHRKTITSEFWTRRDGRIVHVTQVEEEEEGP